MKKGMITEPLLYIAGGIIAALAIYYGVSSALNLKQKGGEASLELLKNTIRTDLETISKQFGSNRTHSYFLGSDFTQICFSDLTKNEQAMNDQRIPAIIRDSAESNSTNNVFLIGPKTEAFNAGEIRVCKQNASCFNATQGTATIRVFGGGGYALFDPCELPRIPVPICINDPSLPLYSDPIERNPGNMPVTLNFITVVSDPLESPLDVTWNILNPNGDTTYFPDIEPTPSGGTAAHLFIIEEYGAYKFTMVATNNASKQCSVTFVRQIVSPGQHFPEAEILLPNESVLKQGQNYPFRGLINDEDAGQLNYRWDFGDGTVTIVLTDMQQWRAEKNQAVNTTDYGHAFDVSGVSRLVKLNVTNAQGNSYIATRRYAIGNTPPWIVLNKPSQNEILPTLTFNRDVSFRFTPFDNESTQLDCMILLLNLTDKKTTTVNLPNLRNATESITAINNLGIGDYAWSVSCSDKISTNSSETRRFSIRHGAPPIVNITRITPLPVYTYQTVLLEGNISDSQSGAINYTWVFFVENITTLQTRVNVENISNRTTRTYFEPRNYNVTLRATNMYSGFTGENSIIIPISNNVPSVILISPPNNTNLPPGPITLNFTANDLDPQNINCTLKINGAVKGNFRPATKGMNSYTFIEAIAGQTYLWNVNCTDGYDSNISQTWSFTVGGAVPNFSCTVVLGNCGPSSIPMLSLSALTNAHVSTNVDDYNYKLCCNLTVAGQNKLEERISPEPCPNPFISLSSPTNAHAAVLGDPLSLYSTKLCFYSSFVDFTCTSKTGADCVDTDGICILRLSSPTNAHAGSCDLSTYENRICCKAS